MNLNPDELQQIRRALISAQIFADKHSGSYGGVGCACLGNNCLHKQARIVGFAVQMAIDFLNTAEKRDRSVPS